VEVINYPQSAVGPLIEALVGYYQTQKLLKTGTATVNSSTSTYLMSVTKYREIAFKEANNMNAVVGHRSRMAGGKRIDRTEKIAITLVVAYPRPCDGKNVRCCFAAVSSL